MTSSLDEFWTDETSVLFTSFWGWTPETWGTVGWSNERGRTYRDNLLAKVSDPFVVVIYVSRDPDGLYTDLIGKIVGFYLMSHQCGHRNEFSHPVHHDRRKDKWIHSLRALRAFSYVCDPLPDAKEFEPSLSTGSAQSIANWGKLITDPKQLKFLRETPWCETPVYTRSSLADAVENADQQAGMVQAGPSTSNPYLVSPSTAKLPRHPYVLRLDGDTEAYLGMPVHSEAIYKIGVSISPHKRKRDLQKSLPRGAFQWQVTFPESPMAGYSFHAAVAGEYAMKVFLSQSAKWLGGEFYLASKSDINQAWKLAHEAAQQYEGENA